MKWSSNLLFMFVHGDLWLSSTHSAPKRERGDPFMFIGLMQLKNQTEVPRDPVCDQEYTITLGSSTLTYHA